MRLSRGIVVFISVLVLGPTGAYTYDSGMATVLNRATNEVGDFDSQKPEGLKGAPPIRVFRETFEKERSTQNLPLGHTDSPTRKSSASLYDEPVLILLCSTSLERSQGIRFQLTRYCPGATARGTRNLCRILAKSYLKAHGAKVEIESVSTTDFPCTNILTLLNSDMADTEFDNTTHFSAPDVSASARPQPQKIAGLRKNLSITERALLKKTTVDTLEKIVCIYRELKLTTDTLRLSRQQLVTLTTTIEEVAPSSTEVEKIKLAAVLMAKRSDIEEQQAACERYRQTLNDLVGADAASFVDKSLEQSEK